MLRFVFCFLILNCLSLHAFTDTAHKAMYQQAFVEQQQMLSKEIPFDFARAVFITENSYYKGELSDSSFQKEISDIALNLEKFIVKSGMATYKTAGNWAVFTFMTEGIESNEFTPYAYDFEDYFADEDMSKMFVTKLMKTKTGNCHSLPYLYKILCEELGVEACLAITPNHLYIKHLDEFGRWTNVELTSASFPKDRWIKKDLNISKTALKNKVYMEPLTNQQTIAMTLFDLSNNYEFQFGKDSFYLSVIDTALKYFPNCIPLLMNKSNYYFDQLEKEEVKENQNLNRLFAMKNSMELLNQQIIRLGHRELSLKQEKKWIKYMESEKKKQLKTSSHLKSKS